MCLTTTSLVCDCVPPTRKRPRLQAIDDDVDRISNLHESIIGQILSYLPTTEEAMRTCILSKKWEFKWRSINRVNVSDALCNEFSDLFWTKPLSRFYDYMVRSEQLINGKPVADIMDRMLLSHNVTNFTLYCWQKLDDLCRLTEWMSAVMGPKLETFRLLYAQQEDQANDFVLPPGLLRCSSLKNLELKLRCTFRLPSVCCCFSNLINLSLQSVEILSEHFSNTDTLILKFKVLRAFEMYNCTWSNVKFVEIHAPALATLKLLNRCDDGVRELDNHVIKILGANLTYLKIDEALNLVLKGLTIDCAYICPSFDSDRRVELQLAFWKLLTELSTVKYWILCESVTEAIAELDRGLVLPRYDKLVQLEVENHGNREGLLKLLHAAPFLKFLEIHVGFWGRDDYDDVEPVPSCLINSLEEVTFTGYFYRDHQFEVEKFLLRNGKQLKKIILKFEIHLLNYEFVGKLSAFPRACSTPLDIIIVL